MPLATILALVQGASNLVRDLTPIAQSVLQNLKSEDQEQLQAALRDLQQAVDEQRAQTSALLRG